MALELHRRDYWTAALKANGERLDCWESLLTAHGGTREEAGDATTADDRRRALGRLRRLIGPHAYVAGEMP
jgi:hypothetical protein